MRERGALAGSTACRQGRNVKTSVALGRLVPLEGAGAVRVDGALHIPDRHGELGRNGAAFARSGARRRRARCARSNLGVRMELGGATRAREQQRERTGPKQAAPAEAAQATLSTAGSSGRKSGRFTFSRLASSDLGRSRAALACR